MTQITYVTGYFELLNAERNFDVYLERASKFTLKISYPLVIFCEPDKYQRIKAERDKYGYLTHYVIKRFEELEFYTYLPKIVENRKIRPRADTRNTAEYQIVTCSKYTMVRDAINKNIFGSQYYAWIDFGLVENKHSNINNLNIVTNNIISNKKDKVRMCFINYTTKVETTNLETYYHMHGRCGIAGGFFTGSSAKLLKFTELCIECFKNTVEKGYGHADEQLNLQVYFDCCNRGEQNDLFDFYFGDYQHIISNFPGYNSNDAKYITLNILLPNVIKDNAIPESKELAKKAVMFLMDGYRRGKVDFDKDEIVRLFEYIV